MIVPNRDGPHWIDLRGYGGGLIYEPYLGPNAVCLLTDDGVTVQFGHLNAAYVQPGDRVSVGQPIGTVGTRGASTGPHLHVEVRTDGANQGPSWAAVLDPDPWLRYPRQRVRHMRVIATPDGAAYVTDGVYCRRV